MQKTSAIACFIIRRFCSGISLNGMRGGAVASLVGDLPAAFG